MMRSVLGLGAVGATAAAATAGVIYDASLGTVPSAQSWQYVADPNTGPVVEAVAGGLLTLDTTAARTDRAGYSSRLPTVPPLPPFPQHPGVPVLDRAVGYTLTFEVRVGAEGHNGQDRAGFSVIAISEDLVGIEIGFWEDLVWAQADAPLFTRAEGEPIDTTAAVVRYSLTVEGAGYTLRRGGATLLAGPLRDYTAATGLAGLVYNTRSYLFLGDNTGSADALTELALVEIDAPPVTGYCAGDLNADGDTTLADFGVLASNFGAGGVTLAEGDLNGDGSVLLDDFSVFASDFGCVGP